MLDLGSTSRLAAVLPIYPRCDVFRVRAARECRPRCVLPLPRPLHRPQPEVLCPEETWRPQGPRIPACPELLSPGLREPRACGVLYPPVSPSRHRKPRPCPAAGHTSGQARRGQPRGGGGASVVVTLREAGGRFRCEKKRRERSSCSHAGRLRLHPHPDGLQGSKTSRADFPRDHYLFSARHIKQQRSLTEEDTIAHFDQSSSGQIGRIIGFIYGYIIEQFGWTVYIVIAGFGVSCLLTLPPWPMYRRNPLKWLPSLECATDEKKQQEKKSKKHK